MARRASISPWPLPKAARDVVLVGGAFDPPHTRHIAAASAARRALFGTTGWILFIPAARSPLKGRSLASDADRLAMIRASARSPRRAAVWTDELDRARGGEPSYTIDTLTRLRRIAPGVRPRLLIGADQAVRFHRWRSFRKILRLAPPAVVLRPPIASPASLRRALEKTGVWSPREIDRWLDALVPLPPVDLSSTALRRAIARGRGWTSLVPPAAARLIRRRGLYGAGMPATRA